MTESEREGRELLKEGEPGLSEGRETECDAVNEVVSETVGCSVLEMVISCVTVRGGFKLGDTDRDHDNDRVSAGLTVGVMRNVFDGVCDLVDEAAADNDAERDRSLVRDGDREALHVLDADSWLLLEVVNAEVTVGVGGGVIENDVLAVTVTDVERVAVGSVEDEADKLLDDERSFECDLDADVSFVTESVFVISSVTLRLMVDVATNNVYDVYVAACDVLVGDGVRVTHPLLLVVLDPPVEVNDSLSDAPLDAVWVAIQVRELELVGDIVKPRLDVRDKSFDMVSVRVTSAVKLMDGDFVGRPTAVVARSTEASTTKNGGGEAAISFGFPLTHARH